MATIQFLQITPEQLQKAILDGVKEQLDQLRKEFQPKQPEEYLSRDEVKELLKINLSTVHLWTKSGRLQAYYLGNRVYYKRSEIEEVLTKNAR